MRAGILIIGSLWWDASEARTAWRQARLDMKAATPVDVAIRYGRKSATRGGSYTMAFSPAASPGKALIVPCLRDLDSIAELMGEAHALWKAEAPASQHGAISSRWGTVGVSFLTNESRHRLLKGWTAAFEQNRESPVSTVNSEGILEIGPYRPIGSGTLNLDVVLATATVPDEPLPSPTQIAEAWIGQSGGHESYFFNNVTHDIRTSDDLDIWETLEAAQPTWLSNAAYAPAISILSGSPRPSAGGRREA